MPRDWGIEPEETIRWLRFRCRLCLPRSRRCSAAAPESAGPPPCCASGLIRSIGEAAVDGRLPSGEDFRLIGFADDFDPMLQLVSGVFARKGEREMYDASHPLNILWDAFRHEAASGRPLPL